MRAVSTLLLVYSPQWKFPLLFLVFMKAQRIPLDIGWMFCWIKHSPGSQEMVVCQRLLQRSCRAFLAQDAGTIWKEGVPVSSTACAIQPPV